MYCRLMALIRWIIEEPLSRLKWLDWGLTFAILLYNYSQLSVDFLSISVTKYKHMNIHSRPFLFLFTARYDWLLKYFPTCRFLPRSSHTLLIAVFRVYNWFSPWLRLIPLSPGLILEDEVAYLLTRECECVLGQMY